MLVLLPCYVLTTCFCLFLGLRLQGLWEWKNRVLLEEYYIFNVVIPRIKRIDGEAPLCRVSPVGVRRESSSGQPREHKKDLTECNTILSRNQEGNCRITGQLSSVTTEPAAERTWSTTLLTQHAELEEELKNVTAAFKYLREPKKNNRTEHSSYLDEPLSDNTIRLCEVYALRAELAREKEEAVTRYTHGPRQ